MDLPSTVHAPRIQSTLANSPQIFWVFFKVAPFRRRFSGPKDLQTHHHQQTKQLNHKKDQHTLVLLEMAAADQRPHCTVSLSKYAMFLGRMVCTAVIKHSDKCLWECAWKRRLKKNARLLYFRASLRRAINGLKICWTQMLEWSWVDLVFN